MLPKLTLPQTVREDARPVQTATLMLEAALDAHREGTIDHLLTDRPGAARWLTRIFLQPIFGAAGDALSPNRAMTTALTWLMEWAITQLRPDRAPTLQIDDRKAWLDSTSWRPAIAAMCHYGFAPVPAFKDRYYRRTDESPADNLCGLWNVGPSTYYRYLEKAKRLMARALYEQRLDRRHASSLREYARLAAYKKLGLAGETDRQQWHRIQFAHCMSALDYMSALWHAEKAGDMPSVRNIVQQHTSSLIRNFEFRAALDMLSKQAPTLQNRVFFLIYKAEGHRLLSNSTDELTTLEEALRVAAASDHLSLGVVYSYLGKYYESRDSYKSVTYYQESLSFLNKHSSGESESDVFNLPDVFVETSAKLAWLFMLRNDPRAETILSEERISGHVETASYATKAMLEQVWGEFFRRNGNFERALEHRYKAYAIYERLDNADGIAKGLLNLGLVYIDMGQFEKALECFKNALEKAGNMTAHSEFLASAHLNMGICHYWQKNLERAEHEYQIVLDISNKSALKIWQARAHHNLAEVNYQLFTQTGSHDEEAKGDKHAGAAIDLYNGLGLYNYADIVRNTKAEMLANRPADNTADRLLPQELAANYPEISEIDLLRKNLQRLNQTEDIVKTHLKIAEIYLQLGITERDQARSLVNQHHLSDQFQPAFERIDALCQRDIPGQKLMQEKWKQDAKEFLDEKRCAALIDYLLTNGSINKSGYAELCSVSLATASKHLSMLAERGLLVQTGKGPATKYVLPQTETA